MPASSKAVDRRYESLDGRLSCDRGRPWGRLGLDAVEFGGMSRFRSARHLMVFLGLVLGERSSGTAVRPRGITMTGNEVVRSHLLEAAWCCRLRAKIDTRLVRRDSTLPEIAREIAWKAQVRLCGRYRRLVARCKKSRVMTTAIARELVGFIWAIGQEFSPASMTPNVNFEFEYRGGERPAGH